MSNSVANLLPRQERDRISELPDDILLKFLSALDMKDAAKTSILSKRWRNLWTWKTDLDFEPAVLGEQYEHQFEIDDSRYLLWVDQVVGMHRLSCIRKFRVCCPSLFGGHITYVEKWAEFALSKRVEELVLDISPSNRLSLGFDMLKHLPCSNGINALKSLHLSHVDVSGKFLEFILSWCHLLEDLYVNNSSELLTLNVDSRNLKRFSLIGCDGLEELEINAVNLVYLQYVKHCRVPHTNVVFKDVSKLVEARFAGSVCDYPFPFLERISCFSGQLTKLCFEPELDLEILMKIIALQFMDVAISFVNVRHLTLRFSCRHPESVMFPRSFIKGCPKLHKLKLELYWSSTLLESRRA